MSFFTHNDIEGWHNGLNKRASGRVQMPLYMLVHLLHKEAYLVAFQIRLVSKRKLTKLQKKITTQSKRKYQATGSSMSKVSISTTQSLFPCQWTNSSNIKYDKGLSLFIVKVRF